MPSPAVSIIVPTLNHLDDLLKPCVESVLKNTNMDDAELIVVANGCTDGTEEWVRSLGLDCVRLIRSEKALGYTKATNLGIQNARGTHVVLLNNDCVIQDSPRNLWIEMLRKPFEGEGSTAAVSGVTKVYDSHSKYDFIIFFCCMVSRDAFDSIGLLDEVFNPGSGEDIDFSIRAQKHGYTIHQVPSNDSEVWSYSTGFPIFHRGEGTVHSSDVQGWDSTFSRNMRRVGEMHRKPVSHSIVVVVEGDGSQLQKCVNSIWRYTDYSEAEIIFATTVGCHPSVYEYIRSVERFGPYSVVDVPHGSDYDVASRLGADAAIGQCVTVISSKCQILQSERNLWLKQMWLWVGGGTQTPRVSAPVIQGDRLARFCYMFNRLPFQNVELGETLPARAKAMGGAAIQSEPVPIFFGG